MDRFAPSHSFGQALARLRMRCLFNRHRPVGRRADWNGETYVSRCEHCETPIFRLRKGQWRRDRRRNRELP